MITTLAVENYRSLRHLVLGLGQLTVVTGANGSGKSSLYRALRLLGDAARNGAVASLAREGGIPSTLWAGPGTTTRSLRQGRYPVQPTVSPGPVGLRLGFAGADFGYAIDLGLPPPTNGKFGLDPQIKCESAWHGPVLRPAGLLAERTGPAVRLRDPDGGWYHVQHAMQHFDSMLSEIADPLHAPELISLHSDLLHPLADLITTAAAHAQIVIVTHNERLVTALTDQAARTIHLIKESGVTTAEGQGILDEPHWSWPKR